MTGVFAQLEYDLIRQRTMEVLEAGRARGRIGGRKAKLTDGQGVCSWNKLDKRADDQRGHRGDCAADSRLGNSVVLRYFSLGPAPPEVLQGGSQRIPKAENWRPRQHPRFKPVGGNSIAQTRKLGLGEPVV
jgi:hypothetical protein